MVVLAIPVYLAALSANRFTATVTALAATLAATIEAGLLSGDTAQQEPLLIPMLCGYWLLLCPTGIALFLGQIRQRVDHLQHVNAQFIRKLYEQNREQDVPQPNQPADSDHKGQRSTGEISTTVTENKVDYAMLLLTIQDISRKVATQFDLETLLPTIVSTARASMKCQTCQVFLTDMRNRKLNNVFAARERDGNVYVPQWDTGMAGWVLEHRQILTRRTVEESDELQPLLQAEQKAPFALAPLAVGGELLGLLAVDDLQEESPSFIRMLYILSDLYALGIKNAQLFSRIEEMARRDGLTGLLNHVSFQQNLADLLDDSHSDSPISVVMFDIDHFKHFNDTFGHQAGDHVLQETAQVLRAVVPDDSLLARYGGEEFICALPNRDLSDARELAELLRSTLESHIVDFEGQELLVTASFGVSCRITGNDAPRELVRRADEALYRAKKSGRNRVILQRDRDPMAIVRPPDSIDERQQVGSQTIVPQTTNGSE